MLKTDGVIWHTAISLDGFAADIHDSLTFMMEGDDVGPPPDNPLVDTVMANVGCTLGGRRGCSVGGHGKGGRGADACRRSSPHR